MPAGKAAASRRIVFSHANGFPGGTYRSLFALWREAGFEVHAIDRFGHDPRFPVTSNWPHLRDELIHFIDHDVGQPAFFVGHSLGGYISVLAAARRPDLAQGVVLLDSPILSGWKARALQVAKAAGIGERLSPGHVSKRRRQHWPSAEAAFAHFAAKPAFARWAPGVLRDYIASGTEPHDAQGTPQQRLRFDRMVETAIYNSLPHHIARVLRAHPLQCPVAFVKGSESTEVRRVGLAATSRLTHGRISTLDGTHLYPMERPRETATEVVRWIEAFCAAGAERESATPRAPGVGTRRL
jgi:pimeloyl-ACP methyl ester carboxylesterase